MATIYVNGEVKRTFFEGKGLEVVESYKSKDGETRERRFTVWFSEPHGYEPGASIEVSGLLSAEVDAYEGTDGQTRHAVKLTVNNPKVKSDLPF